MRLKAYTAETMAAAMQQIRDELGDDAAIVSTETNGDGVRVVAALDAQPAPPPPPRPSPAAAPSGAPDWGALMQKLAEMRAERDPVPAKPKADDSAAKTLAYHGLPEPLIAELTGPAAKTEGSLLARLTKLFRFANLADRRETSPILLAGPPGAGKTLVTAKLAARGLLSGHSVRIITTDTASAGALEQLQAFTRALQIPLETADGPAQLAAQLVNGAKPAGSKPLVIIDTMGANAFDPVELAGLSALIVASRADPVLVMGAGGDARECGEIADAFAGVGCTRLLATRLDLARRMGGVVTAALAGRMAFAEVGASPIVAHGLQAMSPHVLARLLGVGRKVQESSS